MQVVTTQYVPKGKDIYNEEERSKDRSLRDPLRDHRGRGSVTRESDKLLPIGQVGCKPIEGSTINSQFMQSRQENGMAHCVKGST